MGGDVPKPSDLSLTGSVPSLQVSPRGAVPGKYAGSITGSLTGSAMIPSRILFGQGAPCPLAAFRSPRKSLGSVVGSAETVVLKRHDLVNVVRPVETATRICLSPRQVSPVRQCVAAKDGPMGQVIASSLLRKGSTFTSTSGVAPPPTRSPLLSCRSLAAAHIDTRVVDI